jgi:plastocyanin domain-containing protein
VTRQFRFRDSIACAGCAWAVLLAAGCSTTSPPDKPGGKTAQIELPGANAVEAVRAVLPSQAAASTTQTTISIPRNAKQLELEFPQATTVPAGTTAEIARADGTDKSAVPVEAVPGKRAVVKIDPKIFTSNQYKLSVKMADKTDTYPLKIETWASNQ